jgi:nucleoside-diphosphate-sugar epimerase
MRVAVTGASGGLGRYVVADVLAAGHEARAIDRVLPDEQSCPFITADIRDLGQMCGALAGCDALAHLAAIPSPGGHPPEELFSVNTLGTFNILEAARLLGIRRVVTISSAAVLGHAFAQRQPVPLHYFPIDEKHVLAPEDVYGLSKLVGEEICRTFHRHTGGAAVSLRFPILWNSRTQPDRLEKLAGEEQRGLFTLWGYIEVKDAARACRLALEAPNLDTEALYIAAPDTFSPVPSATLVRRYFPAASINNGDEQGHWSLLDGGRAERLIGFTAPARHASAAASR